MTWGTTGSINGRSSGENGLAVSSRKNRDLAGRLQATSNRNLPDQTHPATEIFEAFGAHGGPIFFNQQTAGVFFIRMAGPGGSHHGVFFATT